MLKWKKAGVDNEIVTYPAVALGVVFSEPVGLSIGCTSWRCKSLSVLTEEMRRSISMNQQLQSIVEGGVCCHRLTVGCTNVKSSTDSCEGRLSNDWLKNSKEVRHVQGGGKGQVLSGDDDGNGDVDTTRWNRLAFNKGRE